MIKELSARRTVDSLLRWRWWWLTFAVTVAVFAWPFSAKLSLDRRLESMFRADDPTLVAYRSLKETFGGNAIAMMVYRDPNAFSVAGLERNRQLSTRVASLAGVAGVLSPAILNDAIMKIRPLTLTADASPLADPDDAIARQFDDIFSGYTHTADHEYASVVALLGRDADQATIASLRAITESVRAGTGEAVLVGEPVLLDDGFSLIQRDGNRLAVWTIALLSMVVMFTLRDLRFVAISAFVIFWTVIVTRAVTLLLSIQLSIVSSILTAIVTVITVASVLHLGVRYGTAKRRGADGITAARVTLASLVVPIFWTCATDAAGFAALLFSRIRPVQDFGVMIAIASIAVLLGLLLIAPALMSIEFPAMKLSRRQSVGSLRIRRACIRLAASFLSYPTSVSIAMLTAFVSLLVAVSDLQTETSFLNNFRPHSEIALAYDLVEREFGGAGVWDVVIPAKETITSEDLASVLQLQQRLREIEVDGVRLSKVLSIADVEAVLAEVPLLSLANTEIRLAGMRVAMPTVSDALLTPQTSASPRRLRIMLRSPEQLPAETKGRLISRVSEELDQFMAEQPTTGSSASVTGYYVLISIWIRQLVDDQWRCLTASGILVWLLLVIAFRSMRLATAALLPNLLPVLMVLSVVGLVGDKINMGAAMIAAVSVGLSIDSSVHFLAGYTRRSIYGRDRDVAAMHAAGAISLPVISATVALIIGFSVLGTSEFVPTATFGALIAATLAVGTLVNLTLLPAIVRSLER